MANEERPADWDWVKATHECNAAIMFGVLQTLAKRDVDQRNKQLGKDRFEVKSDGARFEVMKTSGEPSKVVYFQLAGDAAGQIGVRDAATNTTTTYTVGLDGVGVCKFRHDGEESDPWQVLKTALESLLFG